MNSKKVMVGALFVATILGAVGGSSLNALSARAQESGNPNYSAPQTTAQPMGQMDPRKGGHVGQNGKKEELLTGDVAQKVTAAALSAVPGGTIQRVETDAEGSPYEAHMTKADGTRVTVKFDSNFKVTHTEDDTRKPH
jgi:hypothetical protein